jgi:F-type H+-transporting ATPase subunit epsilon
MTVEVISPQKAIYTQSGIHLIQLPGIDGSFEILPRHAPMVALLKEGRIRVIKENHSEEYIDINGGMAEVRENKIVILTL